MNPANSVTADAEAEIPCMAAIEVVIAKNRSSVERNVKLGEV